MYVEKLKIVHKEGKGLAGQTTADSTYVSCDQSCDLTDGIVDTKVLRHSHLFMTLQSMVDVLECLVDGSSSIGDEYKEKAKNEVANVADDVVQSRERESTCDRPRMTAERVVVAEILITTDV